MHTNGCSPISTSKWLRQCTQGGSIFNSELIIPLQTNNKRVVYRSQSVGWLGIDLLIGCWHITVTSWLSKQHISYVTGMKLCMYPVKAVLLIMFSDKALGKYLTAPEQCQHKWEDKKDIKTNTNAMDNILNPFLL